MDFEKVKKEKERIIKAMTEKSNGQGGAEYWEKRATENPMSNAFLTEICILNSIVNELLDRVIELKAEDKIHIKPEAQHSVGASVNPLL